MQGVIFDTIIPLLLFVLAIYFGVKSILLKPASKLVYVIIVVMMALIVVGVFGVLISPSVFYSPINALFALVATGYLYLTFDKKDEKVKDQHDELLTTNMEDMRNKIVLFSIFNSLQDLVLVINPNEMVTFMNQKAVNLLGDQVGMSCNLVLGCGSDKCLSCPIRHERNDEHENNRLELTIKGRKYDAVFSQIYNDPDGLMIMIARDITSRKMVERQLLINEKMLSLGQLVAGVAHEINNPVTFIFTNLEVLEMMLNGVSEPVVELEEYLNLVKDGKHTDATDVRKKLLELDREYNIKANLEQFPDVIGDLKEGAERVKKIVKDLKDFSHFGSVKAEKADINEIIKLTLRVANNEIKNRVEVVTELDNNLPEIMAFPQQLKQAFLNLFVNAAHAVENPDNGKLEITTKFENERVYISISDNGKGIEDKHLRRIFEPFFTTKGVGKGTGLGLAVVYGIIERHGGEIEVQSKTGKGTTFMITLKEDIPEQKPNNDKPVSIYSS